MEDKDSHPRVSSQGPDAVAPAGPSCPPPDQPMPPPSHPRPLISTFGWDVNSIVASSPNFYHIQRIHYTAPNAKVDVVIPEVEIDGNPLIITGWNRHHSWPKTLFNIDWLRKNGDQNPTVRNIHTWSDFKISMDDLIRKLRETPAYASADERERLYGKDGDCPTKWAEWLAQPGAVPDDLLFHGSNDFLKFLPDKAKVQTLMCYMGIGDTFTPFHKDLCASSGQNLMCFSEHGGSAFWFMTQSSAAPQVAAYFHQLGQEVDLEAHVVTIEELAKAPFKVYIAEQQLGDLVLVPPRSCHQVVNKGGITIKTSWSRMSLNGLQTALWHELPIYHRVCRQEIYKVKSNIFHALQHFTGVLENLQEGSKSESCPTSAEHLKQLVTLFDDILAGELSISRDSMPHVSQSGVSHTDDLHCDFCGADIFQSFFECDSCLPASSSGASAILPIGDGLVLCPSCYVEGRTCRCEDMQPVQCRPFKELLELRDRAIRAIERIDSDYINVHGYLFEQPLKLLSQQNANIFEAACKLHQKRYNDINAMRSCRVRLPHLVPTPAAIYCKSCHSSKCYAHLLEVDSVHSVDALMISDLPDGDAKLHQYHRDTLRQYEEVRRSVIKDEERGSRPNPSHKLAHLAKTFTTCRAIAGEVTKHGWYDRLVQTTSIPIANSPAKALVGLSDESDGNKPCDSRAVDDFPSSNLATPASKSAELPNPHRLSTTTFARPFTPPRHANEVQHPSQSTSSDIPDPHSPIVGPMPPPTTPRAFQVSGTPTKASIVTQHDIPSPVSALCLPSSSRPPAVAHLTSFVADDPGILSDLTELPSEVDYSPPRSSIAATVSNHQSPMELSSPSSAKVISKSQFEARSTSKSRVFLECVEISQSSRQKRRRIAGSFLSNVAGPSDADILLSAAQEIGNRSLSQRKRKMTKGPASRPSSSSKRAHFPFDARDHLPSDNILANALNQTFQLNSTTTTSHVSTTTVFIDATPPVNPIVKPKYREAGVQKNLNFTRHTSTTQPSEDPSSCIMRLEAENRDLRAQAEAQKHNCERYRESLEEIQRRYDFSGHHLAAPANFASQPPVDFSAHPRWRMRGENQLQSTDLEQSDNATMETLPLPTPSSPESGSPTHRRRTLTAPRSFGMRSRGDHAPSSQPYMRSQHHRRRRGASHPVNGKKPRGGLQGSHSFDHSERLTEGPAQTNTAGEAVSPMADVSHDKVPPSPPSTISDRVQPPKSPNVP